MNFPSSPTIGTQLTLGALVWTWNGTAWDLNSSYGQVGSRSVPLINYVELVVAANPLTQVLYSNDPEGSVVITYV